MKNFLLSISLDSQASPKVNFETSLKSDSNKVGHGFAWYPEDNNISLISKDHKNFSESGKPKTIEDWKKFRSSYFFMNLNGATEFNSLDSTQPFTKPVGGRDWIFMMQGDLNINELRELQKKQSPFYEPSGGSMAELAFCILLNRVQNRPNKKLHEIGWHNIEQWFKGLSNLGNANFYISDGISAVTFRGKNSQEIFYTRRKPPFENTILKDKENIIELDFSYSVDVLRTQLIFSSSELDDSEWKKMQESQMLVARKGNIVWDSKNAKLKEKAQKPLLKQFSSNDNTNIIEADKKNLLLYPQSVQLSSEIAEELKPGSVEYNFYINTLKHDSARVMKVVHNTSYNYTGTIDRSEHILKIMPQYSRYQQLLQYSLNVSVDAEQIIYRDTFDNDVVHMIIESPYNQLNIESSSIVRIHKIDADDFSFELRKTTIPFAWMPWQRQLMQAYLLPHELPETQLRELTEYAMRFADRNDYKIYETLNDINRTIYKDYKYSPDSTDFSTTAFDVYVGREGVCQDFANLFICMARLLGIPARYRMGYIYTGADYENKIQSEATHAWAEMYLPYIGWRGFDPTNGKMVDQDYVRVASGRNYIDATPTSGTIYKGEGDETLTVEVKTEIVE